MENEVNKYLTEAMGECWHENGQGECRFTYASKCIHCQVEIGKPIIRKYAQNNDFFTWQGFGKLWEWTVGKVWFDYFLEKTFNGDPQFSSRIEKDLVNPKVFAKAIYNYLKERE